MSLFKKINYLKDSTLWIWKVDEEYDVLFQSVTLKENSLQRLKGMKSESHQKGFLAVRMLLQEAGYSDLDLYYDEHGKPHLKDGKQISISHSHAFSVIIIGETKIGIDLEILKSKIITIAPRFMDTKHLINLGEEDQVKKATVIWGIKESIFKIKNEKGISFPDHIFEKEFNLDDFTGFAQLIFNNTTEEYCFSFEFIENYALVCAFQNNK